MGRAFHKSEDSGFILPPEGTSTAVLIGLAYLGQHESTWQGQTRMRELCGLVWELSEPDEQTGQALSVSEVLTASTHEKAKLTERILALSGGREPPKGYDLEKLLGCGAVVTVAHVERDGRTYANVTNVGPMPRGMNAPVPSVPVTYYDILEPDADAWERLPARFKKLIETADASGTPAAAPAHAASYKHQAPAAPPRPAKPAPAADDAPFDDDIKW